MDLDLSSVGIEQGGGGCKGISLIGDLEELLPALNKYGAKITHLGGVSVGGLHALKLAEAQNSIGLLRCLEELKKIWREVGETGPQMVFPITYSTIAKSLYKRSLLDGSALDYLLDGGRTEKPIDTLAVINSPFRLDLLVTNQSTGRQESISNRDPRVKNNHPVLRLAGKATASIPPFFGEVNIFGNPYVDGGHIDLGPAIEAGCTTIFVLFLYREGVQDGEQTDFLSRLFPWIHRLFAYHSAKIKELDHIEVTRAIRIAENLKSYRQLNSKMRALFWRDSKKALVDRAMLAEIDRLFHETPFSFKEKRDLSVIPVFMEYQPESLLMYTFKKEDLPRVEEEQRKTMRRILRERGFSV